MRQAAAQALGAMKTGGDSLASQVARLLNDPVPEVRQAAVLALAAMGNAGAIYAPTVETLLNDPNAAVQSAARQALKTMKDTPMVVVLFLDDHQRGEADEIGDLLRKSAEYHVNVKHYGT